MGELYALADKYQVDLNLAWKDLPEYFKEKVLYGTGNEKLDYIYGAGKSGRSGALSRPANGVINNINRFFRKSTSETSRNTYLKYMREKSCKSCKGERLGAEARYVTIDNVRYPEVAKMMICQIYEWVNKLPASLNYFQLKFANEIINEINQRLTFLLNVGLHYLTLDRSAPSLSGGEGQRIRLATQLGCGLSGVIYVLDEPSIGLHPRDHKPLIDALKNLRDIGNTVIIVEHDSDTMLESDFLIDIGPGAGVNGGEIIARGTLQEVMQNEKSLTGQFLSGKTKIKAPDTRRKPNQWISMTGATLNNLKNVDVQVPLNVLCCITGVSGSGKSSLMSRTFSPAVEKKIMRSDLAAGPYKKLTGLEKIDQIINVTQTPIGRSPRSNPGTYTGVFDLIRKLYAATPHAVKNGYNANRFSFNSKEGSCEVCGGLGEIKVEMHFISDIWVGCHECEGKRFNRKTLDVLYHECSIADVLDMNIEEAYYFFRDESEIAHILKIMNEVGLGYIKMGQSALTLSGGEAQRIKLAKELCRKDTGKTLYILDEPTTGLHMSDIQNLLKVLQRLVNAGNSIIVIEHNMDLIQSADWIIDIGPEGGDKGGEIVACGPPEVIADNPGSYTGRFLKKLL